MPGLVNETGTLFQFIFHTNIEYNVCVLQRVHYLSHTSNECPELLYHLWSKFAMFIINLPYFLLTVSNKSFVIICILRSFAEMPAGTLLVCKCAISEMLGFASTLSDMNGILTLTFCTIRALPPKQATAVLYHWKVHKTASTNQPCCLSANK